MHLLRAVGEALHPRGLSGACLRPLDRAVGRGAGISRDHMWSGRTLRIPGVEIPRAGDLLRVVGHEDEPPSVETHRAEARIGCGQSENRLLVLSAIVRPDEGLQVEDSVA